MSATLEAVARARDARLTSEEAFRAKLAKAHARGHSWAEIGEVAGLSPSGVRYLVEELNERRKVKRAA